MSSITLGSNIASLKTQRSVASASSRLETSFERLSSGLRINHASDDAAGLSVSSSLRSNSRVFNQGIRNISDGISLINIASGALQELSGILIRQQELAEQAANGVYSTTQRQALDAEGKALTDEYNRIVASSKFNGVSLFDQTNGSLRIQAGFGIEGSLELVVGAQASRFTGTGSFYTATTLSTGSFPRNVSSYDVNNDGKLDLISADDGGQSLSVFIGNGDGTFRARTAYTTGFGPHGVAIGDINGDSLPDMVSANLTGNSLSVFRGSGSGLFASVTTISFGGGTNPVSVALADFNGDGKLDLVSENYGAASINIFMGRGDGTFQAPLSLNAGASPRGLSVADLNGDGKNDILTADTFDGTLSIFYGTGSGTFSSRATLGVGGGPYSVQVADLNRDGYQDILTQGSSGPDIRIFYGNQNQTFTAQTISIGGLANEVKAADMDGNGLLDLVVMDQSNNRLGVLYGNGNGTFQAGVFTAVSASPQGIAIGDVSGDGVNDIISAGFTNSFLDIVVAKSAKTVSTPYLYLMTQEGGRQALTSTAQALERISQEQGALGSLEQRMKVAAQTLTTTLLNSEQAASRITDVDVAEESATLTAQRIRQQIGAGLLSQANQVPALALQLLLQ